ncbi:hypothetical protein COO59_11420 [Mixta theicola]|uniref:Uncharacterized protein n=1 Tax=Mixta theicola TaxID=1458355 RepID=A0A2K1Q996_9GAMM|nr:hypothetical protein COO59_11420 [Mixta theicola]GLR08712.1 hypothetical protein GCM10007905_14310 [Mixta theicola]
MLIKLPRDTSIISWVLGFYIIQHNSLHIATPCGLTIDIISALLIFLGINKSCYLLSEFYNWYKGNSDKTNNPSR